MREKIIDLLYAENVRSDCGIERLADEICAIDPARWIYGEDEYGIDGYHCDKCGFFVPWDYAHKFINYIEDYNFCPSCGADMRGSNNEYEKIIGV